MTEILPRNQDYLEAFCWILFLYLSLYWDFCLFFCSDPYSSDPESRPKGQAGNVIFIRSRKGVFIKLISLPWETAILPIARGLNGHEKVQVTDKKLVYALAFCFLFYSSRVTSLAFLLSYPEERWLLPCVGVVWPPLGFSSGSVTPRKRHVLICVLLLPLFYVCSKFIWRKRVLLTRSPK